MVLSSGNSGKKEGEVGCGGSKVVLAREMAGDHANTLSR
jgi:hypothetical protein